MPAATHYRLAAALIAGALLLGVAWWGGLLAPKSAAGDPAPRPPGDFTLDEKGAATLLPRLARNDKIEFDPVAIVRPRAGYSMLFPWPEHPNGRFVMATNAMGFREDEPTLVTKTGLRILVGGDSHPFGLVNNRESFANELEGRLSARKDGRRYEVVNASVSGTGPFEYVGNLRKHVPLLLPDLVIVTLFTGNDFKNALLFDDYFAARKLPEEPPRLDARSVPEAWWEPMGQGFNQVRELMARSGGGEQALAASVACFEAMARLCAEHEVAFLVLVLPTKTDVDGQHDRAKIDAILKTLKLTPEDYALNRQLGERFVAALVEREIPVLDLYEPMREAEAPMFWAKDHHLSVAGHALVAEHIEAAVLELLPEP